MPWNNKSGGGGPWGGGGGGQGPWGGGGGGGGTPPPDLEEMLRRSQDKIKKVMPGGGSGRFVIPAVILAIALFWLASGFYRVQPDEQGVPLIFGKWDNQTTEPGLHWNPPSPIGEVFTPKVTRSNQVNIGSRSSADVGRRGSERDVPEESVMLTSDQNIVDLQFTVLWKIKNAGDYLFKIRNPEGTVKIAAESVMREVVGQTNFDQVVTVGREEIEQRVQQLLQSILDQYQSGIEIEGVKLQKSDPPPEVIDAFIDVQRAKQDKDRLRNEAEAYANSVVPEARGEAEQLTRGAEAYRARLLKEAEGEASRFKAVYETYRVAPEVTRRRMYLETLGEVLGSAQKVIVDQRGDKGSGGVVPYLPLPEIRKRSQKSGAANSESTTPTTATPAAQPAQR